MQQVGGSHVASSSGQPSSKRGPKRPQPLAPFCKYPNAPGTLKPWEGGLVLLDGSAAAVAAAAAGPSGMDVDWRQLLATAGVGVGAAAAPAATAESAAAEGAAVAAAAAAPGGADLDALQEENQQLRQQLERALQTAQQWGRLNSQLQQMCAEGLLANGH